MLNAYLSDVGDGLCMAIRTHMGETVQIDCGSTVGYWNEKCGEVAFEGLIRILNRLSDPNILVLSHFHLDHYSGLAYAASPAAKNVPNLSIQRIYCPGVPAFSLSQAFFYAILTINLRILGDETGIPGYELFNLVTKLNGGSPPTLKTVFQGDSIDINGSVLTVTWPPRSIANDTAVAKVVTQAIELFNEAKEVDEPTKKWHTYLQEKQLFDRYIEGELHEFRPYKEQTNTLPKFAPRKLPQVVEQANWALRRAANRLSLCFFEGKGEFLFFGDVNKKEIDTIINNLLSSGISIFGLLVTPHHDTRWSNMFLNMQCERAASSCGQRLFPFLRSDFKKISRSHHVTWLSGDLPFVNCLGTWLIFP